jgi:probable rRNA maturation factor
MGTSGPLTICHQYTSLPCPASKLKSLVKKIYTTEKIPTGRSVTLILCSDYRIRKLNAEYRKIDRPTDVLSFCFEDNDFLGEIYISLQRAKVQAKKYMLTYDDEIIRLFVHGMFHLLGFDHLEDNERKKMETKEQKYFKV